jgi:ribosomal protein S4
MKINDRPPFLESKADARRLLKQNAIKVNGEVINDESHVLKDGDVVQIGKRVFFKVFKFRGIVMEFRGKRYRFSSTSILGKVLDFFLFK